MSTLFDADKVFRRGSYVVPSGTDVTKMPTFASGRGTGQAAGIAFDWKKSALVIKVIYV